MAMQRHRIAFLVLLGITITGCASAAGEPAPSVAPVATRAVPVAADLREVARTYKTLLDDSNAKVDANNARFRAAGDDVTEQAAAWAEWALLLEDFAASLQAIPFPPEVQRQVDDLAAADIAQARAARLLAGNPTDRALLDAYDVTEPARRAAAAEMRRVLGLPPLLAKPTPTPAPPTPSPEPPTTVRYGLDEPITVMEDGTKVLRITATKVRTDEWFPTPLGQERPDPGLEYLSVFLTYRSLANGADYNPLDWQIFVDDEAYGDRAFVVYGPEPDLQSGTLPKGRRASGWVTYEVPPKGRVVLTYESSFSFSDEPPPFEIVLRRR